MNNPIYANTTTQNSPPHRFEYVDFMALPYEERIKVSLEQLPEEFDLLDDARLQLGIKHGVRPSADGSVMRVAPYGLALTARWEDRDTIVPPRPYLVKKMLPKTGVALLSGVSGSGKSFITLDLAGALAVDRHFFGQKVNSGGTLILASEAFDTLDDRLKAYRHGKLDGEDFWGHDWHIPPKLPISYAPLDCISEQNFDEIMEYIKFTDLEMLDNYFTPLRLIVIDTFAAASGLEDENSSAQVTGAMKLLHRMAKESGTLVMPVVHHGKNELSGVRGSSAGVSSKKHVKWCRARYKTYNASTDTFVGKGGRKYRCNSPYDGRQ
jgi:Mrp family chromosome partitioning ATPase